MTDLYSSRNLFILLLIRFLTGTSLWIFARLSYVFYISVELRSDVFGTRSFTLGLILTLLKILVIFILELIFSSNFTEEELEISEHTWKRLIIANILLLIAELMTGLLLFLELSNLLSINFVRSIITTASLFTALLNPSGYTIIFWLMICFYIAGMAFYMYPRPLDETQRSVEYIAFFLFIRSILLPI